MSNQSHISIKHPLYDDVTIELPIHILLGIHIETDAWYSPTNDEKGQFKKKYCGPSTIKYLRLFTQNLCQYYGYRGEFIQYEFDMSIEYTPENEEKLTQFKDKILTLQRQLSPR